MGVAVMPQTTEIRPQPGPQDAFLASPADIAIYGGAAFGGKTYALLLDPLRHINEPAFGSVIFRRTSKQVLAQGGLWDTAGQIYPHLDAEPQIGRLTYAFPSGARVTFAHLQHEDDKFSWQGAQLPYIGFDELTHFTAGQFWYLVSRNRDPSGQVRPYIRCTCNPDPDSFVLELVDWWIDSDTGLAIRERSGIIRYFIRYHDELAWADSPDELTTRYPDTNPKSLTFIAGSYRDNRIGMSADPGYLSTLEALPRVERERLKEGNWKVRASAGDYFRASDFPMIERSELPPERVRVRYWDRAATVPNPHNPDPDWTAGPLMSVDRRGRYYIEHVERFRARPGEVQERIVRTAGHDGHDCIIGIERDPGQAGVFEAETYVRELAGYDVRVHPATSSKETRAAPFSAQAQAGNVTLVRGPWNDAWISEAENFPIGGHDDQVDGASGAFAILVSGLRHYAYIPVRASAPSSDLRSHRAGEARRVNTGGLGLCGRKGGLL